MSASTDTAQFLRNALDHAIGIAHHIIVPEPEHAETLRFDEAGARFVIRTGGCVFTAVNLDDELGGVAAEVGVIWAGGACLRQ
jgi:hypothetical protein